MKKFLFPILIIFIAGILFSFSVPEAFAETLILRPDSNYSTQLSRYGCSTNYQCVNDVTHVLNTVVYTGSTSYRYDLYNLDDSSDLGDINKVIFHAWIGVSSGGADGYFRIAFRTNNNTKYGAAVYYSNYYMREEITLEKSTNPVTGSPWTWNEINDLKAGISLKTYNSAGDLGAFCSQIYVVVEYILPVNPPTVTTDKATLSSTQLENNQATLKGNVTVTGGENPSQRVLEWGTSTESYTNSHDCGSGGTGEFSYPIPLNPGTIYYYRAKAYNNGGWGYGTEKRVVIYEASGGQQSFETLSPCECSSNDIGGCCDGCNFCPAGLVNNGVGTCLTPDSTYHCNSWENCDQGDCSATQRWYGCTGTSETCSATSYQEETVIASNGYVLKADCSEVALSCSDYCGTAGEYCGSDRYRYQNRQACGGGGFCNGGIVGCYLQNCGETSNTCSSKCQKDYTYTCSAGTCGTYHTYTTASQGYRCEGGNLINTGSCAQSDYNGRSADKCDKKRDLYRCNGTGYNDADCNYDVGDEWVYVSANKIANVSGQEMDASSADNAGTCHDCIAGDCSGTYHWGECDGSGNAGPCATYNQSESVYADTGYTLTATCGKTGAALCGYSSWNGCNGSCQKKRDQLRCDATHNCAYDVGDDLAYLSTAGKVCSAGSEVVPSSSINCDKTIDCVDNSCSAARYYRGCTAEATSCTEIGKVSYTVWNAPSNYTISETTYKVGDTCATNQDICGYSAFNKCGGVGSPYSCEKGRDQYRCNGTGSCTYDAGDDWANVAAGYVCSGGSEVALSCSDYCGTAGDYCGVDRYRYQNKQACGGGGSCNGGIVGCYLQNCGETSNTCWSACRKDYTYTCSAGSCGTYHDYTTASQGERCENGNLITTGYCDDSGFIYCNADKCQYGKDLYRCDGLGYQDTNCSYKVDESWEDCPANQVCSAGVCSPGPCGTKACPNDYCSGNTLYDYPSSCNKYCLNGSCGDCTCTASPTPCGTTDCSMYTDTCVDSSLYYDYPTSCDNPCLTQTGDDVCGTCGCDPSITTCSAGGCCQIACDSLTGCYTTAGTCPDSCGANSLIVGETCSGCGANGAVGTCGGGITYTCNSTIHTECQSANCGGITYYCTQDGGTWQWRTSDNPDRCGGNLDGCYNDYDNGCQTKDFKCSAGACTFTPSNQYTDTSCSYTSCSADKCTKTGTYDDYYCDAGFCTAHSTNCSEDCNLNTGCSGGSCLATNYCVVDKCRDGDSWHHRCNKWCDGFGGCNNWVDATCVDHCTNSIRDCNETGIDCGGSCPPCDITSPTVEIRIFDSANNDITDIKEWLKADTYTIKLIAKDETKLASGEYYILAFDPNEEIISPTTTALSGKEDTILLEADAGKLEDKPGTDYWREGVGKYLIWFTAKDEAGNEPSEAATRGLSFDFTLPETWLE